jgi:glutamate---cysteine ligase / carboxylate-amine ligase
MDYSRRLYLHCKMDGNAASAYTFGIEEEFFLCNLRTRHAMPRVTKRFVGLCSDRFGKHVTYELQQTQVEIVSPVFTDADEAMLEMARLRSGVAEIANTMGMGILAAGSHPLAKWQRQQHTDKARYDRIVETFQLIGRRDVVCGMHVHVAVPNGDRVALMNRLLPWLPLFLALSTSSPFWNRQLTGLMSYRQAANDEWPRTGIPDFFADENEYNAFVARLMRANALKDASELWWAIRPSLAYPTLELRIADSCTRLEDAVALATLFRCLVRAHARNPDVGAQRTNLTRRLIDENRWRALRYGTKAEFIDEARDRTVPVAQFLAEVRELVAPDALALGANQTLARLDKIAAHGTSADAQLEIYNGQRLAGAGRVEALRATVGWLLQTTSPAQALHVNGPQMKSDHEDNPPAT